LVMRCCALLPLFCFSSSQTYQKKTWEVRSFTLQIII
jgi:hypothetical protein